MVRFAGVGLHYADPPGRSSGAGRAALQDLTFTLPAGSFHWLLGESGAGKSSLLRLMQLAQRPTSGVVEVLGADLSRTRRRALPGLRRRIGVVWQDFRLLPHLTVRDNVALPLRIAGRAEAALLADVAEMLRWAGLESRADALPAALSGGEQQRAALARAVVMRPALLLADEPTGNLDAAQARRVLALLQEMHRLGTTVVVATHAESLVEAFPAPALRLRAGRLMSHG
ncbi:cell division ATP-binding protein FtsE [Siccirubricoccus soli]|nr:ATP-binding cassette domain-containing protein [Siccirubricoccus soli]